MLHAGKTSSKNIQNLGQMERTSLEIILLNSYHARRMITCYLFLDIPSHNNGGSFSHIE